MSKSRFKSLIFKNRWLTLFWLHKEACFVRDGLTVWCWSGLVWLLEAHSTVVLLLLKCCFPVSCAMFWDIRRQLMAREAVTQFSFILTHCQLQELLYCTLPSMVCRVHKRCAPPSNNTNSSVCDETLLRWVKTHLNPVHMYLFIALHTPKLCSLSTLLFLAV